MTWIKICGTTNLEDALMAVEAGADALGFVFYEKSPRNVTPEVVREIIATLPEKVAKVGVFVNESVERINDVLKLTNIDTVQLYGHESVCGYIKYALQVNSEIFPPKIISAVQASILADGGIFIADQAKRVLHAILLDSGSTNKAGGTGERFDWEKCSGMVRALGASVPLIVAGGLNPENVGEAIRILNPWGVDVVSGVEARPGKKDPEKVRAFIGAVRQADKSK
jgi:phosphoribosylanthranilate isomerase